MAKIPATARVEPKMARAMPASPQLISSFTRHMSRPVGSEKHWAMKSKEYSPFLAASSTPYEQSVVENRMAKLIYGGVEYRLVGASNSAKDGKFYFVDLAHSKQIAERFQHWPEAAMVYFAILVSDCRLMVDEPNFRVAVVQEHALGTNDCRGWVRESVYRKLKIGTNRFCQFRLAFDAHEPKQAKGALKAMSDRVADRLGVDFILPDSATKPALKGGLRFLPQLGTSGRLYTGPAVLGIKEISRALEFGSSYTLVEHASEDSLQLEIMPRAIEQIRKVRKAWDEGDYDALLELLGKSSDVAAFEDEDSSFDPESLESGVSHVSEEWEPAEAVLLADRSGTSIEFPYVSNQINRKLARWAFRICTGGGFRLPAFANARRSSTLSFWQHASISESPAVSAC